MINLYLRFGVALHVALMVIYSSWARGGSSPYYLWALPWLSLGVIEIMFLMPPMGKRDTPRVATSRLIKNIFLDPVTYLGLFLVGYLTIQWMNGPCELVEDSTILSGWKYSDPPWPSMPFCVDRGQALQVLLWFIAVTTAVIAVRHAMKPSARYFILKLFVANGALLSILGFLQAITCPGKLFWFRKMPVYFFSTFGYPNHAGTFFMMTTALSMGLLIRALGDTENKRGVTWLLFGFFLNAAGIYGSLSRAAILMGTAMIAAGFIYGLIYLWRKIPKLQSLAAMIVAAVLAIVIAVFAITPGSPLKKELDTIDFSDIAASVQKSDRQELADTALAIWQDHPWTGVGGWGFIDYVGLYMPEEKWNQLKSAGRANVHNDPLQFLCEHGMIGAGLMAAITIVLLVHALIRLGNVKRTVDPRTGQTSSWGASVSPCVWAVFAATGAMLVHCTIDLPFRSIANTLIWFICLACLPGFIPQEKKAATTTVDAQDMPSASNRDTGNEHHHHHHSNGSEHHHHSEEAPADAESSADVPDSPSAETGAPEQ